MGFEALDEALDDGRRLCSGELVHELAVAERLHVRDALDAVAPRDVGIRVDVDLDELDGAFRRLHGALDHGREPVTGPAPLGPEVDEHRHAARALDDRLLETRFVDVDRHGQSVGDVRSGCREYDRRQMAEHETYDELARPAGAEVVGVFINGVPLVAEQDYEVLPDRIHLKQPVKRRTSVSAVGKVMLSIGIGVYNKGDVVDVQLRSGGKTQVVRGRRFGES